MQADAARPCPGTDAVRRRAGELARVFEEDDAVVVQGRFGQQCIGKRGLGGGGAAGDDDGAGVSRALRGSLGRVLRLSIYGSRKRSRTAASAKMVS